MTKIPATIEPEQITAVIDTREQIPLDLAPLRSEPGTLTTGDYSIRGLEHLVAIERKSLPDLLQCIGKHRARFEREIQRLLAFPARVLVVESTWSDIERGEWRGKVIPSAAIGSLLGWVAMGLPVIMASDHRRAGQYVSRLLYTVARRRWRESRQLITNTPERP